MVFPYLGIQCGNTTALGSTSTQESHDLVINVVVLLLLIILI